MLYIEFGFILCSTYYLGLENWNLQVNMHKNNSEDRVLKGFFFFLGTWSFLNLRRASTSNFGDLSPSISVDIDTILVFWLSSYGLVDHFWIFSDWSCLLYIINKAVIIDRSMIWKRFSGEELHIISWCLSLFTSVSLLNYSGIQLGQLKMWNIFCLLSCPHVGQVGKTRKDNAI